MDEVTIGGITYLPASKLAKQYRYTTDYIGQLCRSKKVDAQLVGRSWYVNPVSLASHKNARYTKSTNINTTSLTNKTEDVKLRIEPSLNKSTAKALRMTGTDTSPRNFAKRIDWKPLKYEVDESDLLPSLKREPNPILLKVDLADSSDITIKSNTKSTTLVPEDLPEVSLKGSVKVESLNEYFDTESEAGAIFNELLLVDEVEHENKEVASAKPFKQVESPVRQDFSHRVSRVSTVLVEEDGSDVVGWSIVSIVSSAVVTLFLIFASLTLEHRVSATASSYAAGVGFSTDVHLDFLGKF